MDYSDGELRLPEPIYNVLFLCTHNSARSLFAEVLLNRWGHGRFHAFSAGSHPSGEVHPLALALLTHYGLPTEGLRSKSWDEFDQPGAPRFDFVFTVCDKAAAEACPVWPGQPMSAHWGVEDPAALEGNDAARAQAFREAFHTLEARIRLFTSLPIAKLDAIKLGEHLEAIGRAPPRSH
ncbi:MAG: arsenate reductase ArsC [Steroidobacterales bacterium]